MRNKELIQKLQDCAAACTYCADACLDEDNLEKMIDCIRTDNECAAICEATVKVAAQKSTTLDQMLKICEEICRKCEEECRKHDSEHCQDCADACKACAEACVEYA